MGVGFKSKIMLHCFREVKYQQGYTPDICIKTSTLNERQWPSSYMLNFKVASGVNFRTTTKHLKLRFYKNRQQMMPASIMNV